MEWQPIETVPIGKEVLLAEYQKDRIIRENGKTSDDWYIFTGFCELVWRKSTKMGEPNWVQQLECECSEYEAFAHYPSYWMSLPNSP